MKSLLPEAKRTNATRPPKGKALSSREAMRSAIRATGDDFVPLGAEAIYERARTILLSEFNAVGPVESECADRLVNANWRVQLCRWAKQSLEGDQDPDALYVENAMIDAMRDMLRFTDELRRIQSDRIGLAFDRIPLSETLQ